MKKSILFGLVLIPIIFLMVACGDTDQSIPDVSIPGAQTQPPPTQPPPTQPPNDCDVYEGLDLDIVVYTIFAGDTTVTLYSKFPDESAALADESLGYYATLGGEECLDSKVFEGEDYMGRVYHICKITKGDYDSTRHYQMYKKGCDDVIHDVPYLSLMVEGDTTSGSGGDAASEVRRFCGFMPNPSCKGKFESWCDCVGGDYQCKDSSLDWAVCWNP